MEKVFKENPPDLKNYSEPYKEVTSTLLDLSRGKRIKLPDTILKPFLELDLDRFDEEDRAVFERFLNEFKK